MLFFVSCRRAKKESLLNCVSLQKTAVQVNFFFYAKNVTFTSQIKLQKQTQMSCPEIKSDPISCETISHFSHTLPLLPILSLASVLHLTPHCVLIPRSDFWLAAEVIVLAFLRPPNEAREQLKALKIFHFTPCCLVSQLSIIQFRAEPAKKFLV